MYVHAGGKIEALGTGMWAAPRGVTGDVGAVGDDAAGAGMMTVEVRGVGPVLCYLVSLFL